MKIPKSKPDQQQIQAETKGILQTSTGFNPDFMEPQSGVTILKQTGGGKSDGKGQGS